MDACSLGPECFLSGLSAYCLYDALTAYFYYCFHTFCRACYCFHMISMADIVPGCGYCIQLLFIQCHCSFYSPNVLVAILQCNYNCIIVTGYYVPLVTFRVLILFLIQ